jgi:hypothetical protein
MLSMIVFLIGKTRRCTLKKIFLSLFTCVCFAGCGSTLGYVTKVKPKCEMMYKNDLKGKDGPELKCGVVVETDLLTIK